MEKELVHIKTDNILDDARKIIETARETERQINSQLYERLLISNDKETLLATARKERHVEKPTIGIRAEPDKLICKPTNLAVCG